MVSGVIVFIMWMDNNGDCTNTAALQAVNIAFSQHRYMVDKPYVISG